MGWIKSIFTFLGSVAAYLNNRQLLKAGEDVANAKHSARVLEDVEIANKARRDAHNPDERDRLRNKYTRPE